MDWWDWFGLVGMSGAAPALESGTGCSRGLLPRPHPAILGDKPPDLGLAEILGGAFPAPSGWDPPDPTWDPSLDFRWSPGSSGHLLMVTPAGKALLGILRGIWESRIHPRRIWEFAPRGGSGIRGSPPEGADLGSEAPGSGRDPKFRLENPGNSVRMDPPGSQSAAGGLNPSRASPEPFSPLKFPGRASGAAIPAGTP